MHVRQYDVTTAYLNGELGETILMEPPNRLKEVLKYMLENGNHDKRVLRQAKEIFNALSRGDQVCHMRKALYGLKQAGRVWHKRLDQELRCF